MADKRIDQLPASSGLTDDALLVTYQDKATKSIKGGLIKKFAQDSVAGQVQTATNKANEAANSATAAANSQASAAQNAQAAVDAVASAQADAATAQAARAAAETSAANAGNSATSAAESARLAEQAALGGIPDGSLEPVKFSGASRSMMVRDNLLHNSYFGNPDAIVDQRGGYVVLLGKAYRDTPDLNAEPTGTTDAYYKATYYNATFYTAEIGGVTRYVYHPNVVRGYVGAGYGIDRWKVTGASSVIKIIDGGITFTPTAASNGVRQDIEFPERFAGKEITASFLLGAANGVKARAGFGDGSNHFGEWGESGIVTLTGVVDDDATTLTAFIQLDTVAESPPIVAGKLELGSQQTLAHQDEDGNWVLNEIPDYGETLRKCQRYYEVCPFETLAFANGEIDYSVPLKVTKRTNLSSANCVVKSVSGALGFVSYFNGTAWVDVAATVVPVDIVERRNETVRACANGIPAGVHVCGIVVVDANL